MTPKLPKKIELSFFDTCPSSEDITIAEKVNELIAYLLDRDVEPQHYLNKHREVAKKYDHISTRGEMINSDKKEASKTAVKTLVRKRVDIKTATKYCDVCKAEKGMIHLYEECIQEASKGECADVPCMHCPAHVATCHICHKPQEESKERCKYCGAIGKEEHEELCPVEQCRRERTCNHGRGLKL